ncbi:hypothetical protein RN001_009102 [Aquatica leii]|uniref:WD repeat-containing protein 55 homolog n=1 Tax=Aquatica leii TaxID=1421715 RepID=A0AAN7P750_9COLE|nr:hypothetical protein RN001_009102 [Aquatica leii]
MSNCQVHNVRFYKPKPEAIYCMSLHKSTKKLAVSRADAVIEIWNLKHVPYIERTIVGTLDNSSIEGLTWCGDSLFSVGLNGLLIEYDLFRLTRKRVVTVTGEAACCIDVTKDNKRLAVGTEQGYINIFKVNEDDVLFEKFLDKQEGRILCLKYDPSCQFIASGSLDAIRIWDVETGHALHRMTTGRATAKEPTIVWCIHILQDLTIISGDSRGKLTFWDGKIGAQIESFQSHKCDILAMCVSDKEDSLYCAGVDPNIVNYAKIKVTEGKYKWVKSVHRKVHDHDVRDLILCDEKLYSGGIDGYLACTYYPPKTLVKYPPVLQNPCITIAKKVRYILLRFSKHLEVWSLGKSSDRADNNNLLHLAEEPMHLLSLQRLVKNNDSEEVKESIICASMSSDGKWIVFSTNSVLRIFGFNYQVGETPTLSPIEDLPKSCSVSLQVVFTPNSRNLILAPQNGGLQVYDLIEGIPILVQTISTQAVLQDTITFLEISQSGQHLVAADPQSNIVMWTLNKESEWEQTCKLPIYSDSSPTSLSIHPSCKNLVVMYADHKMIEFDMSRKRLTRFSKSLHKKQMSIWPSKSYPVRNIIFDQKKGNVIILHDDSHIVVADPNKPLPRQNAKIPKIELTNLSDGNGSLKSCSSAFHAIKKYKHLVYLGWLSEDELVAVEVSPLSILEQLPPCLKQAKFGTK